VQECVNAADRDSTYKLSSTGQCADVVRRLASRVLAASAPNCRQLDQTKQKELRLRELPERPVSPRNEKSRRKRHCCYLVS
jgi:hypothetical protein